MKSSSTGVSPNRPAGGTGTVLRLATITSLALGAACIAISPAHAVTIDWVTVGDPGNLGETKSYTDGGTLTFGAVGYEYRIMTFEFTNTQYAAFLNAIDPDGTNPNEVYNSNMGTNFRGGIMNSGTTNGSRYVVKPNMGDKPVNYVNWFDAARVSNWLHNGAQTYGNSDATASAPQNTGAYTVGTSTFTTAARNAGALFYIPTENEWYKAAFYNPTLNGNTGGYRVYGNGFDTAPGAVTANVFGVGSAGGSGNFANYNGTAIWNGVDPNVTTVGTNGGASYYGAFDMSGNVSEWNDLDGSAANGDSRGVRNGHWLSPVSRLSSSHRYTTGAWYGGDSGMGFRLASTVAVPEPSTYAMALAGLACGGYSMWRRRRA